METQLKIFVDMDGVLTDFEKGYAIVSGLRLSSNEQKRLYLTNYVASHPDPFVSKDFELAWSDHFWSMVNSKKDFWETLPPMEGFLRWFTLLIPYKPAILTLCPPKEYGHDRAKRGKKIWLEEHLPTKRIRKIFRTVDNLDPENSGSKKSRFCTGKNCLLIDDNVNYCNSWRKAGGEVIQYESVEKTIIELNQLGIK